MMAHCSPTQVPSLQKPVQDLRHSGSIIASYYSTIYEHTSRQATCAWLMVAGYRLQSYLQQPEMSVFAGRVPRTALPPAQRPVAPAFSYRVQCLPCNACREQQAAIWRPPRRRAPAFGRRPPGVSACAAAAAAAPVCSSEPDARRPVGPALQVARPALCAAAVLAWALVSAGRGGPPLASLSAAAGHASQEGEQACAGGYTLLSRSCELQGVAASKVACRSARAPLCGAGCLHCLS